MKAGADSGWDDLASAWTADQPSAALNTHLGRRVQRHSLQMRFVTAMEVLTLVALAWFTAWILGGGAGWMRVLSLAAIWIIALFTMGFGLWNRRGSWQPATASLAGYLTLTARRARAKIRVARIVRWLAPVQATAVLLLVLDVAAGARAPVVEAVVACGLLVLAYLVWSVLYERGARAELADLDAIAVLTSELPPDDDLTM